MDTSDSNTVAAYTTKLGTNSRCWRNISSRDEPELQIQGRLSSTIQNIPSSRPVSAIYDGFKSLCYLSSPRSGV